MKTDEFLEVSLLHTKKNTQYFLDESYNKNNCYTFTTLAQHHNNWYSPLLL